MPKISVVIPVYKVEDYLMRCIDSVINQSYRDFDLILVDDGSPDQCGNICDRYAQQDHRVTVIHQKNGGLSAARNAGIEWALKNSDSEWITYIDSDDWVHPCYLEYLYNAVKQTGCSVAIGGFDRMTGEHYSWEYNCKDVKVVQTEQFYAENKVWGTVAWGKLYKKSDFAVLRYPHGLIHEDEFTTYKVLFQYEEVAVVDIPLYAYYQNPQSIMGSKWSPKHISEADAMLQQYQYFVEHSFSRAAACLARLYIICLYRNYEQCSRFNRQYAREKVYLQKRLRQELIQLRSASKVSLKNASWIYYAAFPVATAPYRLLKKLFRL